MDSVTWSSPPTQTVSQGSFLSEEEGKLPSWFEGGKLNPCFNMVDRHVDQGRGDTAAIIYESDDPLEPTQTISYKELQTQVCKTANLLSEQGIVKGTIVTIYMTMHPSTLITLLALSRIGAVHSVVFAGFSPTALADRIVASRSEFVICNDEGLRGGKVTPLKGTLDSALEDPRMETTTDDGSALVKRVLVFPRTGNPNVNYQDDRDLVVSPSLLSSKSGTFDPVQLDSSDPLFILYTSGSTGNPKAISHNVGGYLVYAAHTTSKSFGLDNLASRQHDASAADGCDDDDDTILKKKRKGGEQQVVACVADIGWITGQTYLLYGPLTLG
jgi:acetyl-CoA synthetase